MSWLHDMLRHVIKTYNMLLPLVSRKRRFVKVVLVVPWPPQTGQVTSQVTSLLEVRLHFSVETRVVGGCPSRGHSCWRIPTWPSTWSSPPPAGPLACPPSSSITEISQNEGVKHNGVYIIYYIFINKKIITPIYLIKVGHFNVVKHSLYFCMSLEPSVQLLQMFLSFF